MHDCLQVQDIIDLIFTRVYQDSPERIGKQDLLSLALTCHDFQETALDILWHTQTNLVQLVKTLPHRCWNEEPDSGFDRKFILDSERLDDDDLARLTFYTRRIRHIRYLPYVWHAEAPGKGCPYDLIALRTLWNKRRNKTIPLFPNLLGVEFVDITHASPCLDIFLETRSISLSLYWSESDGDVTTLFDSIENHALNMQELDLGAFQGSTKSIDSDDLSHLVSRMTDLRRLSCASRKISAPAIQHLSSLPHLRTLQIPNTPSDILLSLQSLTAGTLFPELHSLVILVDDFLRLIDLVKVLHPLQLQDLTLHCSKIPSPTEFHKFFMALEQASSQCSNLLRIVLKYIWPMPLYSRRSQPISIDERILINGPILEPLLSFRNLAILELDIPCKIELGDAQLMTMADAWPRLRRLRLGAFAEWHLPLLITFNGFMHLLRSCRELEYLAFAFNASSEIPVSSQIPGGCINKNITYLYVGDSRIDANYPTLVARFLAHVFPNLCGIGGVWLHKPGPAQWQWRMVADALKNQSGPGR